MVILGASAPKCDVKPANPTSSSQVGTMSGSVINKKGARVSNSMAGHRTHYQGLLQAPKIPGIFDHQLIKTNFEDATALPPKPQTSQQNSRPKKAAGAWNSQSSNSISGLRPGQKTIRQQRDLAQLRFYQTLTNQPNLIKSSEAGGSQAPQVKMLSNMREA